MKTLDYLFKYGAIAMMVIILVFFSLYNPVFFTYGNISDILRSISIVTLVAIGVTFTLAVDGFEPGHFERVA